MQGFRLAAWLRHSARPRLRHWCLETALRSRRFEAGLVNIWLGCQGQQEQWSVFSTVMSSSVMKTGLNEGDLHQRLAARLKRLGNQTDIERIYNEAVQRVLRKYNNNNISDDLLDRLVATNSADELLQDVEAAKVKHQEPKRFRLLSEITASAQWSLEQFERFGKCVDVMVQSRMVSIIF